MLTYISPGHSFPIPVSTKEEQERQGSILQRTTESRDEQAGAMGRWASVTGLKGNTDAVTWDIWPTGRLFLSAIKLGHMVLIRT